MITVAPARRRPHVKVIGSMGVLAAAAAVAGLGTFGTFTDSTTPLAGDLATGTVSIDLAAAAHTIDFPDASGGWKPGDRSYLAMDLVNTGSSDLSSVVLDVTAPESGLLDSDRTHGLQVTLDGCDQAWDTAGGAYVCPGTVTHHYAGPIVMSTALSGAASLAAGGVDHLLATATLPDTAGNEFMGARSTLGFLFTGTQRAGTDR